MTDAFDAELDRLSTEFVAVGGPDGRIAAPRGGALAWFRTAWPALASASARIADDEARLAIATMAIPFLVESEMWADLVDVAGWGAAAAARTGADDEARRLSGFLAAGLQRAERYDEAEPLLQELVADAVSRDDHRGEAAASAHLGQLHRTQGNPVAAVACLQQSLAAYRRDGYGIGVARAAADLARALHKLGDDDGAARYSVMARQGFASAGDRRSEARSLRDHAGHEAARDRPEVALGLLADAAAVADAADDPAGAAEAFHLTARVHLRTGDNATACGAAADALSRARMSPGDPGVAEIEGLVEVTAALASADALMGAATDAERAERAVRQPEILSPMVPLVLERRAAEGAFATGALRARLDAALTFLRNQPSGAVAERAAAWLDDLRRLAGPAADRLPPASTPPCACWRSPRARVNAPRPCTACSICSRSTKIRG